jgi:hypothetical protein
VPARLVFGPRETLVHFEWPQECERPASQPARKPEPVTQFLIDCPEPVHWCVSQSNHLCDGILARLYGITPDLIKHR